LSAAVAKLETEMGAKLFERRRDRMVPTPAGSWFLEAARGILLACNSIESDLRGITAPRMLRVGFLQTLSTARIADLVGAFRRARPDVAIGLFDDSLDGLQRGLDQKRGGRSALTRLEFEQHARGLEVFVEAFVLAVGHDALTHAGKAVVAKALPRWAVAQRRFESTLGKEAALELRMVLKEIETAEYG